MVSPFSSLKLKTRILIFPLLSALGTGRSKRYRIKWHLVKQTWKWTTLYIFMCLLISVYNPTEIRIVVLALEHFRATQAAGPPPLRRPCCIAMSL